ncbi:hypothetical protein PoB_006899900 [Plakobranchus ocellatus]|uniref:Uncharacterized protein n=1 Tax=Plakobranchus ocellatus TaxID=259542 RepID=A0AAV4DEF2_9GAST|nr:hypothetical protein PoB_006899900 [Plakobranchus ocellatus]
MAFCDNDYNNIKDIFGVVDSDDNVAAAAAAAAADDDIDDVVDDDDDGVDWRVTCLVNDSVSESEKVSGELEGHGVGLLLLCGEF